ncbi:ABC transporter permease [Nocardia arizonensis]|uniref:ABC transporter permease n=1 Tax=Nocardia arizonensis TaxID=1141647 RepID=UPI0006CFB6A5|nr:ABC transporter permease [Nocardia arizonensis]
MTPLLPPDLVPALHAEARKVSTLRSNRTLVGTLLAVTLVATGVTALISGPADPKSDPATGAASVGLYLGIAVTVVAAGIFGAFAAGAEFRNGSMPLTVLSAPDRDRVVASKYLVTAVSAMAACLGVDLVGFGCLLLVGRDKVEVGPRLFAVLGCALIAVTCWSLIGAGLALLLRQASGTVALLVAWLVVIEPLIWVVAGALDIGGIATLLPGSATVGSVAVGSFVDSDILAPTPAALVVLLLWTVGVAGAGWWTFRTREL